MFEIGSVKLLNGHDPGINAAVEVIYSSLFVHYTYTCIGQDVPVGCLGAHSQVFYLPMHTVCKVTSTTTKLHVVFDDSAKSSLGISLNNQLLIGPTVHARC